MIKASAFPAKPRLQQDVRVSENFWLGELQFADQIGAIVQADIGYKTDAPIMRPEGLTVKNVLRKKTKKI